MDQRTGCTYISFYDKLSGTLIHKSDNDMMDDQNGEVPATIADEKQAVPEATPVPAPESVEPQKPEGDEPAAS